MNSLYGPKSLSVLLVLLLAGCQSIQTREDIRRTTRPGESQTTAPTSRPTPSPLPTSDIPTESDGDSAYQDEMMTPPPAPVIPALPKIGIILGAGGAKTYAHVGLLQELSKAKVPVFAIAGIEFAAPMAALFAKREMANDVEWQMFKLKEEEVLKKSLLGGINKNNEVSVLNDFFQTSFGKQNVENYRIPFACPSYSLKKNQVYLMNRGSSQQVLSMCMAYPPFFKPYKSQVSAVRDITATAQYLRQKGANFILFVNVLQPPGGSKPYTLDATTTDNVLWSEIAGLYNKPLPGVDAVLSLSSADYGIMDFEKRREIMAKGSSSASRQLKELTKKWGL